MHYQITAPPLAAAEKQAEELGRLLRHSKQMTLQFVTVAGRYKPTRARLTLLTVPDRVAEQAARVIHILSERDDAVRPSAAVRQREEWKLHAILVPTDPAAAPPDGGLLDGWDSVCLTVVYQPGRVVARLMCCVEDADRLAKLSLPGWRLTIRPKLIARAFASGVWQGMPSFAPVPGGLAPAVPGSEQSLGPAPVTEEAPLSEEVAAVLTKADDGILLGVAPDGEAVRLARRAMTLALVAPSETRQTAILALLRRGMQAGLGMVVAVERSLLPSEALAAWEARVRLLDVQDVASSCAIPWQQIAPDLLAQAIAGPAASLPALPIRFATALDQLGASALRVPAVLGLVAQPGDELRRVLAAGGLIVVPQDGDAASTVVARLLLAYLATPPPIGRAALLILDPALIPPDALRDQAIQVVLGERGDALLRMAVTDAGWRLSGPGGAHLADMLPDLMAQPSSGTSELVETIIQEIGAPQPIATSTLAAPAEEEGGWWATGERSDDLHKEDEPEGATLEGAPAAEAPAAQEATPAAEAPAREEAALAAALPAADLVVDVSAEAAAKPDPSIEEIAPVLEQPQAEPVAPDPATHPVVSDLDAVLESLLDALLASEHPDMTDQVIQSAVTGDAFADADALAVAWAERERADPRPYTWRVVLAEDDSERAAAAEWALRAAPDDPHAELLRAVLNALGAADLPADGLAWPDASSDLTGWPVLLDDEGGEREPPLAASGWEALDEEARPIAVHGHQNGVHASLAAGGDEPIAAAPGGADLLTPAEADRGHQNGDHAFGDLLAGSAASADGPIATEVDRGHQDGDHASLAAGGDEPVTVAPGGAELLTPVEADRGHQDGDHAFLAVGGDEPATAVPIGTDLLAPAEADRGHQDGDHALSDIPADLAAGADEQATVEADRGHQNGDHASPTASADEPIAAAPGGADLLTPAEADRGHQDGDHASPAAGGDEPAIVARGGADLLAPAQADRGHQNGDHAFGDLPAWGTFLPASPDEPPAAEELDDTAIRAAWLDGASVPALIARLTDAGVPSPIARTRVRGAISSRPATPAAQVTPTPLSPTPAAPMIGIGAPIMEPAELDDAAIWRRWLANEKMDDLVLVLCGRRGGTKADAARDRIYAVVVPQIVAELKAGDLVDQLLASDDIPDDPRYELLMKRLARSQTPPTGALEQSLRRRLAAARQEV